MSASTRRSAAMMLGGVVIVAQAACGTTADPPSEKAQLVVSSIEDLVQGCDDVDTLHLETQTKNPRALCPVTLDSGITKLYGKAQSLELTELFEDLMTTAKGR